MHIGNAMRRLRKGAGIQQNVMARKIGISTQALWAIENETWLPKRATINKFCEVLGICRAKLILEALSWEDMPIDGASRDDVLDIISLALLRIHRYEQRKSSSDTIFSKSDLEEQTRQLKQYNVENE